MANQNRDSFGTFLQTLKDYDKDINPDLKHIRTAFNQMSTAEKVKAVIAIHELTLSLRDELFNEIDSQIGSPKKKPGVQSPKTP